MLDISAPFGLYGIILSLFHYNWLFDVFCKPCRDSLYHTKFIPCSNIIL